MVIDVDRETRVRPRIVEWLGEEDLVDGLGRGLDAAGAGEIIRPGLPDEAAEGEAPRPGGLGGAPVQIRRQEQLGPVHV
jgi:hypothetical protein